MKILVLIKEVPDTWGDRHLDVTTGLVDRTNSDLVMDEIGERAVEAALDYKDGDKNAEVVVMSMGPSSVTILRKALAMGATSAVHVLDSGLSGADMSWTAATLAAAIRRVGFDLVITGNESTDGRGGVIPAMIAEHLGVPHATALNTLEIDGGTVRGERTNDDETLSVSVALPAIVSITERMPEARFPSFKGTMTAKKKPLETLSLSDLGVGGVAGHSVIVSVAERPAREAGLKVVDDGTAAEQLADFLASRRLI